MQRPVPRIAILHHTGGGNLGDQASVDAVMHNIRHRWPDSVITLLSMNPTETAKIHGVLSHPLRTYTWGFGYASASAETEYKKTFRLFRWLRTTRIPAIRLPRAIYRELAFLLAALRKIGRFDTLVVSGGGQLTGKSGPWGFPYGILIWFVAAKIAGTKRIFLNVGAGPLTEPLTKFFVNRALYAADYVSFRDQPSQILARTIGFQGKSKVFPDNVYSLEAPPCVVDVSKRGKTVVGIAPLAYPSRSFSTAEQKTLYDDVIEKFAFFASSLTRSSYSIELFGTDVGEDPVTIEDLRAVLLDRYKIAAPPYGAVKLVPEMLKGMSAMDYVVTCRFHGLVFAHLLNKPVIAISPHPKVADHMSALGLSRYCVDIETFDAGVLVEMFEALVREKEVIKRQLAASLSKYRSLLKSQLDELFPVQNEATAKACVPAGSAHLEGWL
jgi:polysaccharide pyruvyl transferase WcaK-like protein